MHEPFMVGGYELKYPCDPDGPSHEVYNCRCTTHTGTITFTPLKQAYAEYREKYGESAGNGLTGGGNGGIIKSSKDNIPALYANHIYEKIGKIDISNKSEINASLNEFEDKYRNSDVEHCRVIAQNGDVYDVHGSKDYVNTSILGDKMAGSINEHNHVRGESQYSFGREDFMSAFEEKSSCMIAFDEKYRFIMSGYANISPDEAYETYKKAVENVMNRKISEKNISDEDEQHEIIAEACKILGVKYDRRLL